MTSTAYRGRGLRLVIADDHAMFRSGLRGMLERIPDLEIVGEAEDTSATIDLTATLKPSILVLDLSMPGGRPIQAIPTIVEATPSIRIIVLTMHDDLAYLRAALAAGAVGYVLKRSPPNVLLESLRAVRAGRMFIDPAFPATASEMPPSLAPLSRREREVLELLAQGLTYREAGARLHVSERTIETHRRHIGEKLDLRTRADLVRYAVECGILTPVDGITPEG